MLVAFRLCVGFYANKKWLVVLTPTEFALSSCSVHTIRVTICSIVHYTRLNSETRLNIPESLKSVEFEIDSSKNMLRVKTTCLQDLIIVQINSAEWQYWWDVCKLITAKLWDARFGEVVHTFEHEHIVKSVNFNQDDSLLLTASNEKLIRVFDLNRTDVGGMLVNR